MKAFEKSGLEDCLKEDSDFHVVPTLPSHYHPVESRGEISEILSKEELKSHGRFLLELGRNGDENAASILYHSIAYIMIPLIRERIRRSNDEPMP